MKSAGLVAGPVLAAICFVLLPREYQNEEGQEVAFTLAGRSTLAVMVWMAVWWLTEAIKISGTALLPLFLFPVLGVAQMKEAAAPYANPLIFLFMGGFLLGLSMQRWGLDRRIALRTLRMVGTRPRNMVGGFMLSTAILSAFVSNTATAAMMLPIAVSVLNLIQAGDRKEKVDPNFPVCLMLGIAYAASVGGVATIIGTPPNAFLVGFLEDGISLPYRRELSFATWLLIGLPVVVLFLPIIWLLLTCVIFPIRLGEIKGGAGLIQTELKKLGRMSRAEWAILIVFSATAACWVARPFLTQWTWMPESGPVKPFALLTDPRIAMTGALALFVIPSGSRQHFFVLDWHVARDLPWGILILFGGGLSLAAAVTRNGVAEFLGSYTSLLAGMPSVVLVIVVTTAVIFLTELTSNTATTATLVPILAALAPGMGVHPYLLIIPAAIAASLAFMMPVATPPNAIVFGSGQVTIRQMCRAGWWLNLVGIALVTLLAVLVIGPVLGVPV